MRIGSLFSGYGGLDVAVEFVTGATPAWFCEFEPAPSKILAAHWPSVPNLGDITTVDWPAVEPVDIITGGSPCQDLSHAGRRAGMTEGTRSNLWVAMREAIAVLRPPLVVWENVRGALSADADSAMEPCPGCVGDEPAGNLRALGRVLGDLADLGYDCRWHGLRAADVGAPHGRFRVFVVAHAHRGAVPVESVGEPWSGAAPIADGNHGPATDSRSQAGNLGAGLRAHDAGRVRRARPDHGALATADAVGGGRDGRALEPFGQPVRRASATGGGPVDWGQYAPAIRRWEHVTGRPAPAPTEPGTRGGQRLSPRFVEWMMGMPDGWVTDVPGISGNDQLKMLGNGVVPQQAAAAIRIADAAASLERAS